MSFKALRVSKKLEDEGVWETLEGGSEVLVARWGNDAHSEFTARAEKREMARLRVRNLPEDVKRAILIEGIARHILRDWRDEEQGEYTVAKAIALLSDPAQHDTLDDIFALSRERERYREQCEEEARGNLPRSSDGNSETAQPQNETTH
jgi:hypothetical protein